MDDPPFTLEVAHGPPGSHAVPEAFLETPDHHSYYDPEAQGYNKGHVYVYWNSFTPTGVRPQTPAADRAVLALRPNPAWTEVNLALELDRAVAVRVTVYDVAGREVARPIADEPLSGRVTRAWRPVGLPRGVYYVRASLGDRQETR